MLDIQYIRDNPNLVEEKSKQKGYDVNTSKLLELDKSRRETIKELSQIQSEHNLLTNNFKSRKPDSDEIEKAKQYKDQAKKLEEELKGISENLDKLLKNIP